MRGECDFECEREQGASREEEKIHSEGSEPIKSGLREFQGGEKSSSDEPSEPRTRGLRVAYSCDCGTSFGHGMLAGFLSFSCSSPFCLFNGRGRSIPP